MMIEAFKAKHDFNCSLCKRPIKKDNIFFKEYQELICVICVQEIFEKKIENLKVNILDYKNLIGKAYMLSKEYYEGGEK